MQLKDIKKIKSSFSVDTKSTNQPSELTRDFKSEIRMIPIGELKPFKFQARKNFDEQDIKELAETIKLYGIRSPLTVFFNKEEELYEIVSGERRFRAAMLINLEKLPCIILTKLEQAEEIALVENIQRKDLHPIELREGIERYMKNNPNLSKEEVFKNLGISKAKFYRLQQISKLTPENKSIALANNLSSSQLIEIANNSAGLQFNGIEQIKSAKISAERAMNKKCKVLQLSLKGTNLEIETFLSVLSYDKKVEAAAVLTEILDHLKDDLEKNSSRN